MTDQTTKWVKRWVIFFIILLSLLLLAWLFPYYDHVLITIGTILLPFVLALVFSLLLHPIVKFMVGAGVNRSVAILLIFTAFFTLAGFGIYRGYPHLLEQLKMLSEQAPQLSETYKQWTKAFYAQTERLPDGIHERADGSLKEFEEWLSIRVMSVITGMRGLFDMVFLMAVIPVMTFYFLKDYKKIGHWLLQCLPGHWHHEAKRLTVQLNHSLGGYIRGQLFISLFVGVLASVGFWIIDLPYPLVLGILAGVTNIIPYFGPLLGAVPALIVALTMSWKIVIFTLIVIIVIQLTEGNLLSPYIMGRSIHIHPLFIILALLAGGEVAGIAGLILAVPILTCVKVVVSEVREGRLNIDR
ncbi:AI-2E family transporter [Halobacillus litoralis]|uniref:AI-2E family transporter n=1 Tax=Halobacillus litoralis TaxID=45668 RepID=UPI001CD74033|nr:AI-2E family transporter [Halobacillus litoralis]MCA0969985.1 AI-2E family transporter [Halobacillus litoralis]